MQRKISNDRGYGASASGNQQDDRHTRENRSNLAAVDAYFQYTKIVGNDDGGQLFTPEEYKSYCQEVLPIRIKNRVFVSWTNSAGMDCKLVGPETQCFCQHRYKQHQTDFKDLKNDRGNQPILLPCNEPGCHCSSFTYVPKNGTNSVRCNCKHLTEEHKVLKPFICQKAGCKCSGFRSSYTCGCGEATHEHRTIVETKEERLARGHPVGEDVIYKAMGGLTGFSSLADGYQRLDPSGIGRASNELLEQPISASDHPILRQFATAKEDPSAERRAGESELDYYERRYNERMKKEKIYRPRKH